MKSFLRICTALAVFAFPSMGWTDVNLLMAEEPGCSWCARWNAEVGDAYHLTDEGRTAPLQRFDLHDGPPDGVTLKSGIYFTPTFVLVKDGVELSRIEGYPGEDFFWGFLARMLENADLPAGEPTQDNG